MQKKYRALNTQMFASGEYAIVPIRKEDRYSIMKWRNEQIYHLRQKEPLTKEKQDEYFETVVVSLFKNEQPDQMLFSYLKEDKCIGYGGLVHINWIDRNAEISFIMDTSLENGFFEFHWSTYLGLIEQVAFQELQLHKIFTYAYNLRPKLYTVLTSCGFVEEAVLKEHCLFDGKYVDVLIHSKLKEKTVLRNAGPLDIDATYAWANDKRIRAFAYNQFEIQKKDHINWFKTKLKSHKCFYYILEIGDKAAGSIRFDIDEDKQAAKISYLVDSGYAGKGFGTYLLKAGVPKLLNDNPNINYVFGFVLKQNLASIKIFKKLGYEITFESDTELKYEKRLR